MNRKRQTIIGSLAVAVLLIVLAWHAPKGSGGADCDRATGTQTGHVTLINDESEPATVRQSTGPVWNVGAVIPNDNKPHTQTWTKPGSFSGNVTVTVSVNYPSDRTLRPTTVTVHFPGGCSQPTTTTTVPATTTTTAGTSTTTAGVTTTSITAPPQGSVPATPVTATASFTG